MNSKSQKINTLILVMLFALISQFILLSWSKPASAESTTPDISWTTAKPTIFSSTPTEIIGSTSCSSSYQIKQVMGNNGLNRICTVSGPKLRFGTYTDGNFKSVVSFRLDTKMYPLHGICDGFDSCLYIPTSDTMIAKHSVSHGFGLATAIYRNFSEYIKPVTSIHRVQLPSGQFILLAMVDYYEFDSSTTAPDTVLENSNGYPWPIGGANISSNGNWVVIEFNQRGIGVLNTQTLEMKRVSDISLSPANYNLSLAELAISNDGNHIAAVGYRTSPVIIDVTPDCSEAITDTNMSTPNYPMIHACKQAQIDTAEFISSFQYALDPRFDDSGGELGFYAVANHTTHTTNDPKTDIMTNANQIVMRAAGYTKQRIDYLALGDSFSSGEGELDDTNYQDGTNDEYEKCHVSKLSYPFLIIKNSDVNSTFMKSIACSGAKTTDIIGSDDASYSGQGNRLKQEIMSNSDITMAQTQAKNLFIPGRIHQQKFVSEYKPKVITVGVGGNDAGLMDKLKTCAGSLDICEWAGTPRGRHATAVEINNLFNTLVGTYTALHEASPSTKIYAVGYPQVINSTDNCQLVGSLLTGWLLDTPETKFMNESIKYLNLVVEAATKKAGVKYINIEGSYGTQENEDKEDQRLCGSKQPTAANEIAFGDDFNPIYDALSNWTGNKYFGSNWVKFIGNESFHPNSEGHKLTAKAIDGILNKNIVNYNYCPGGATICPDSTVTAPDTPDYWIPPAGYDSNGDPIPIFTDYIDQLDSNPLTRSLFLDKGSLSPGSPINLEAHSDPISLGQFQAADDGSFNTTITLPDNLEEGYHTIHLYGTSYSGEPVDIYQVINYEKSTDSPTASPNTPSEITIANNTTTTNAATINNTNTTNTTATTKAQSAKTAKTTDSSKVNSNTTSSINDQLSSPTALATPQTVKSDVSKDKALVSVLAKGKDAKNTDKSGGMSVYATIGVIGVVVVIVVATICLVKRSRSVKK